MTEDARKAFIRSMLMLELNNVFTKTYRHFADQGTEEDRQFLNNLVGMLKDCVYAEPPEVEIEPE